jgi:hypothetical protein
VRAARVPTLARPSDPAEFSTVRQTTWQVVGSLSERVSPRLSAGNRDLWSKQGLVGQNWDLI